MENMSVGVMWPAILTMVTAKISWQPIAVTAGVVPLIIKSCIVSL